MAEPRRIRVAGVDVRRIQVRGADIGDVDVGGIGAMSMPAMSAGFDSG